MRRNWPLISLMATAAILPGAALAQQAGGAAPATAAGTAAANTGAGKIEEVVVTAQKRTQTAQRTPVALRIVSGKTLQAEQITDVQNLARVAPDLGVIQNTVYTQLAIRGISEQTFAEGSDAALTVDIDGEYINRPVALNASFFDLSRVEILKGPQGTLYGRNATAGAINIITAKPENKYEGYFTAGIGTFASVYLEGAVNIPVTPDLAVRVSGFHSQHNGYDNNGLAGHGDDANQTGARASVQYTHDGITAYVSGEYINVHTSAPPPQYGVPITPGSPGLTEISGSVNGVHYTDYVPSGNLDLTLPDNGKFPLQDLGYFRTEQYHVRERLAYDFGDGFDAEYVGGYLSSHTATYIPLSGDADYDQFYSYDPHLDSQDWSNDLHLSYRAPSGLFAQVGGFYFHENQSVTTSIQVTPSPFGPPGTKSVYVNYFFFPSITDTSYAFYGQGDYPILDNLKLTAGARYSHDQKQGLYYNSGLGFVDPAFGLYTPTIASLTKEAGGVPSQCNGETAGANDTIINHCYSQGQVNWLVGLEYTPAPNHLLYFKASTASVLAASTMHPGRFFPMGSKSRTSSRST